MIVGLILPDVGALFFLRDRRPLPSTTELGICGKSPVPEVTVDERLNDRDERARVPPPSGTICKKDDHIFFFLYKNERLPLREISTTPLTTYTYRPLFQQAVHDKG